MDIKKEVECRREPVNALSVNVGWDVPMLRVTFSGYFSGSDAYFCGFLLGPVHMFESFSGADAPDIFALYV